MSSTPRIVRKVTLKLQRGLNSKAAPKLSANACIAALSKPSWSVRSLLPSNSNDIQDSPEASEITPAKLHHLLKLAALPPPSSPKEEAGLIKTLLDQLHFVKDVQSVDTTGVSPLQMIRDETIKQEVTLEDIMEEEKLERWKQGRVEWNVLGLAERKVGSYFVVDEAPQSQLGVTGGKPNEDVKL